MKKIGLILATAVMLMLFAFSASAETEGYYTYEIKNGEATIIKSNKSISGDITIPSELGGYPVTSIGIEAFYFRPELESVTIPDCITSIADSAFANCDKLKEVTIGNGVTSIDGYAFYHCDSLTSVTIGNNVTTIDTEAFRLCLSLKNITIPEKVIYIADDAFDGCYKLEKFVVDENNKMYSSDESGVLFNKNKTELIAYPIACKASSYKIPDSVEVICKSAFQETIYLKNLELPENLRVIEDIAFAYAFFAFDEIYLSDKVEKVGTYAFANNPFLEKIYIEGMSTDLSAMRPFGYTELYVTGISKSDFADLYIGYHETNQEELYNEMLKYVEFPEETYFVGTIYCHKGSTAEAYAVETGMKYELIHFYEDEWHEAGELGCLYRKCIHCDEKEVIEHNMSDYVITKESTCTEKGEKRADCANCDYYITREIPTSDHYDEDYDGYCDGCGKYIADENCICICHAKTIGAFFYKLFKIIDLVFNTDLNKKVFGITEICVCGIKH